MVRVRKGLAAFNIVGIVAFCIWVGTSPEDEDPTGGQIALGVVVGLAVFALCVLVLAARDSS